MLKLQSSAWINENIFEEKSPGITVAPLPYLQGIISWPTTALAPV
jgi:hypothetical protein